VSGRSCAASKERYGCHHGSPSPTGLVGDPAGRSLHRRTLPLPDQGDRPDRLRAAAQLRMEVTSKPQVVERPKPSCAGSNCPAGGEAATMTERVQPARRQRRLALSRLRAHNAGRRGGERLAELRDLLQQDEDCATRSAKPSAMGIWGAGPAAIRPAAWRASNARHALEDELSGRPAGGRTLLREQVEEGDHRLNGWARWTGIPMQRRWPASARNCLSSKTGWRSGSVGQPEAVGGGAASILPARPHEIPRRRWVSFPFLGPHPASARTRTRQGPCGGRCSIGGGPWCASI